MKKKIAPIIFCIFVLLLMGGSDALVPLKIMSTPVQTANVQVTQPAVTQTTTSTAITTAQPSFTVLRTVPDLTKAVDSSNIIKESAASVTSSSSNTLVNSVGVKSDIGTKVQALIRLDKFLSGLTEMSNELHVNSKTVSGSTEAGKSFNITITATDADDMVTRISVGKSPYASSDYTIKDCTPAAHSCTLVFTVTEATVGTYNYMIKAKNDKSQVVNDAITVNVVPSTTTGMFYFRTAALDGSDYSRGIITYVNSDLYLWHTDTLVVYLVGMPFATFSVPASVLFAAQYEAAGYINDTDHFYLDYRLPGCSGSSCSLTSTFDGVTYTTACNLVISDYHYSCVLSNSAGYSVSFDYRATSDPIGPNTVRRYNPIYRQASPIVEFGTLDANFIESASYQFDLDDYVTDNDTAKSAITWSVSGDSNLDVIINPTSHAVTIRQDVDMWIGNEMLLFTARDPQGNTDSDSITVRVLQSTNDAPVIISTDPVTGTANVGSGSARVFSIEAMDPDYDPLTITWKVGATTVAIDTFAYTYVDLDGSTQAVTVTVSDGTEEASASWTVVVVSPIGTLEGTVTEQITAVPLDAVTVQLLNHGTSTIVNSTTTDSSGHYSMMAHDGNYDVKFSKFGYYTRQVNNVVIAAGEVKVQNTQLQLIPPEIGTLQGTVTNAATSAPITGVFVEVMSGVTVINTTLTNGAGHYDMTLQSGTYDVRFSKSGFQTNTSSGAVITTGATTTKDITLAVTPEVTGTIQGTVTYEGIGGLASGVLVEVFNGVTVINSTTTSAAGTYNMVILGGMYDVQFSKTGYMTHKQSTIVVPIGTTTTVDYAIVKWWNAEWQKKYKITVPASTSYQSYNNMPFKLVFNASNMNMADCQSNGGDVRILNSAEDTLVAFNLSSWSSTEGIVYVNEHLSNTVPMTYYLYCDATTVKSTTSVTLDVLNLGNNMWASWSMNGSSYSNETNNLGNPARNLNEGVANTIQAYSGGYFGRNHRGNFTGAGASNAFLMTNTGAIPAAPPITVSCVATVKNIAAWGDGKGIFYFGRDSWVIGGAGFFVSTCATAANGIKATIDDMGVWGGSTSCVGSFTANGDKALMTMTWDGTTQNVYFNTTMVSQSRATGWNVMEKIKVGGVYNNPGGDIFYFDECNVWNEVISPAKVSTLYNSGSLMTYPFYASPAYTVSPAYG